MKLKVLEGKPRITLTLGELEALAEKSEHFDEPDHAVIDFESKASAIIAHSSSDAFSRIAPHRGVQMKFPEPDKNVYMFNLTDEGYSALKERGSIITDYFEIAVER
ncbi:MAG: hypothetical protein MUF61_03035 [archaeon]|jgi:hypothetical protein|nr:hypothetical protein [archaeon]